MQKIRKDDSELLSYEKKKEIIKRMGQKDLLDIFDSYKPNYSPIKQKKSPLDQQISLGISKDEKIAIAEEVRKIKNSGDRITVSSLVRTRAVSEIDIEAWRERAEKGLKDLISPKWNKEKLTKDLRVYYAEYDDMEDDDEETAVVLNKKIKEVEAMIQELERPTVRRSSRMSGRVTFNEANLIRWRAGRLTLTVADYMRFLIFGYLPFTENDRHLSIQARKRFYVSVIDVAENGWGSAPVVEDCQNCARYAEENKELRTKLERMRAFAKE